MELPAIEFLRRFLLHVVPARFTRIRYYGFLDESNELEIVVEPYQHVRGSVRTPEGRPASCAHEVFELPHEVSELPHGVFALPHDVSALPHDVSALPHGVSELPHDVSARLHEVSKRPHEASGGGGLKPTLRL